LAAALVQEGFKFNVVPGSKVGGSETVTKFEKALAKAEAKRAASAAAAPEQ